MATMISKRNTQIVETSTGARAAARAEGAQRAAALDALLHRAESLEAAAARHAADVHELAEQARLARGTREIPTSKSAVPPMTAAIAVVAPPTPSPATHSPLYLAAEVALEDKPHTFRDLCTALGIDKDNENSLKSVLVRLQRDGRPMVNLGNGARAIWWIDVHNRIGEIAASRPIMSRRK